MTKEEHITRAMLLGMYYHEGNGEPFYYKKDSDGVPDPTSFIDAETLEPMVDHLRAPAAPYDWKGLGRRVRSKEMLKEQGIWLK